LKKEEEEGGEEEEEGGREGGREGREVLRFNKEAQGALAAFLAVDDWRECGEEKLQQFVELMKKV
jgi:putative heme iron utilization protein